MSVIKITDLTFGYDGSSQNVFEELNLTMDSNWRLGLVGRNGRGKTTLLKLLSQAQQDPTHIQASQKFLYFPHPVQDMQQTPMEIFHDLCPLAEDWELLCELSLLDLDTENELYERPFASFSPGERAKILLASLFVYPNGFLLLDEPESHMDEAARKSLASYLKAKKGFILVSHDRMLLDEVTDHTLSIEKQQVRVTAGSFSVWYAVSEQEGKSLQAKNEQLKKEIGRLSEAQRRSSSWANAAEKQTRKSQPNEKIDRGFVSHKAAKAMKRSKNIEKRTNKAIEDKKGLLENLEESEAIRMEILPTHTRRVLALENVQVFYDENPVNEKPLSLDIQPGERVQLAGPNGCGKSSLIRAVMQGDVRYSGQIQKSSGLVISQVRQDLSDMKGALREFASAFGADQSRFFMLLRKMGMEREIFDQDLSSLSMGQKKKAAIAASLCKPAHLYVWDEPLNHLDVISRMQIEEMILESQPTMLFVEHDEVFGGKIATKVIDVTDGTVREIESTLSQ